jgi:hypothetical protein
MLSLPFYSPLTLLVRSYPLHIFFADSSFDFLLSLLCSNFSSLLSSFSFSTLLFSHLRMPVCSV